MNRITDLIPAPDKKGEVEIYVNGRLECTVSDAVLTEAGLKVGLELDFDALESAERKVNLTRARHKAYDLLSYGDMSAKTLYFKLLRAGFDEQTAGDCLAVVSKEGYIDDRRFAAAFAEGLVNKSYGPRRIEQRLYEKGIDRELAGATVEAIETDWVENAKRYIRPGLVGIHDRRELSRALDALVRRGFDYVSARAALGELGADEKFLWED